MNPTQKASQALEEVFKATPPSATLALSLFGVPLTTWATILSIVVLLLQAYFLIRNNTGGRNGNNQNQGDQRSGSSRDSGSEPDPRV